MQPHQQRVIAEQKELEDKLHKLLRFFETSVFQQIENAEQERLKKQAAIMKEYSSILIARIAAFK